jgi:hypothetical protein
MKARYAQQKKEEKDNVQRKETNHEECRHEVQVLRDLRVRNLHLRLPEERVPLPGKQLPVWLPQISRRTLAVTASSARGVGEAASIQAAPNILKGRNTLGESVLYWNRQTSVSTLYSAGTGR